jgi:ABC-type glycerol-3-phosphate transport system substrate-binding protein
MITRRLTALFALLILAGCSLSGPSPTEEPVTPAPEMPAGSASSEPAGSPGTPGPVPIGADPTATSPAGTGLLTLRLWVPPRFAPDPATEAGALLKARLDEFSLLHPGIRITVRVKGEEGPGGMVASLDAIGGAVPESLPDLVLIPRLEMERAAGAGLLAPFPEPLEVDWYDFARALAVLAGQDGTVYGLPFAGDALVMVYRPGTVLDPPRDWTTTAASPSPLLFAGASPNALFTLAQYRAAGGDLLDPEGRPFLDLPVLTALLEFYAAAGAAGAISPASLIAGDEAAVYQAFLDGGADLAVAWVSDPLNDAFGVSAGAIAATALPTVSAVPYTPVTGWMWALSNPDPGRLEIAADLAVFLTAPEFLAAWTFAAGVLPPRAAALANWPEGDEAALASRIVLSAHPLPPLEVVEETGPALQAAVEAVLTGELTPAGAAETAVLRVNGP